jgi:hypothetical protein
MVCCRVSIPLLGVNGGLADRDRTIRWSFHPCGRGATPQDAYDTRHARGHVGGGREREQYLCGKQRLVSPTPG